MDVQRFKNHEFFDKLPPKTRTKGIYQDVLKKIQQTQKGGKDNG